MNRRILISLIGLITLIMAPSGLARDLAIDERIEAEQDLWEAYQDRTDVETDTQDAWHGEPDKAEESYNFADRFINPHPELGCLYYDENNIRRWFRYCREL